MIKINSYLHILLPIISNVCNHILHNLFMSMNNSNVFKINISTSKIKCLKKKVCQSSVLRWTSPSHKMCEKNNSLFITIHKSSRPVPYMILVSNTYYYARLYKHTCGLSGSPFSTLIQLWNWWAKDVTFPGFQPMCAMLTKTRWHILVFKTCYSSHN